MSDSKVLKARCNKYDLHFCLELKEFGLSWKVVNMVRITKDESKAIGSELKQSEYYTNSNLLPCVRCGNRKIGGCNCSQALHPCSSNMKYQFDCVYCDCLEIDYSRPSGNSPYTKWAGISNIPEAIKDRYGNPSGSQYDLAQDGSFSGYKIVVLNLCPECGFSQPAEALRKKGFDLLLYSQSIPTERQLELLLSNTKTQLWVIADKERKLTEEHIGIISACFDRGQGVYIWGDNDPYYVDANRILLRLFGTTMNGNKYGDCVLGIQKDKGEPGIIQNHLITTGIVSFYEGITIADVKVTQEMKPLIYGSMKQIVAAYYDKNNKRALIDGGFTRLYHKWDSAGTDRYVVNAAAWLANVERFGYQ